MDNSTSSFGDGRSPGASISQWDFTPSLQASILFLVLFLLTTLVHIFQAILYRQPYCIVIISSALAQTLTYNFRTLSIKNPDSLPYYEAWFVLILISPLFTNAFVYMVFGRMVWKYTDDHQLLKIKAWNFTRIFLFLDIVALAIQLYGAATAATTKQSDAVFKGLHVYMGGVGTQQLFILIFCLYACKLLSILLKKPRTQAIMSALWLLGALLFSLALITMRICFRLAEYGQGLQSTIPEHEAYQYCFDSLPMLIALAVYNLLHPGRFMDREGTKMQVPSSPGKVNFTSRLMKSATTATTPL